MRDNKGHFVKGHTVLPEWKQVSRQVNLGQSRHNTPHSEETKLKISQNRKGLNIGEKNPIWKGDEVSYSALHHWVNRHLGKARKCEECGIKGQGHEIHWANKSHKYLRILSDWISLCVDCHAKFDKGTRGKTKYSLMAQAENRL